METAIVKKLRLNLEHETPEDIRKIVRHYYYVQEIRLRSDNVLRGFAANETIDESEREAHRAMLVGPLQEMELTIRGGLKRWAQLQPIYTEFLSRIKGIGPVLGAGFPAYLVTPGRFATVSKLWAYCGLHTEQRTEDGKRWFDSESAAQTWIAAEVEKDRAWHEQTAKENGSAFDAEAVAKKLQKQIAWGEDRETSWHAARRRKGEKARWSASLKVLCWKTGESFVKSGDYYREIYDHFRVLEDEKHPDLSKGHRFARAKRRTVKIFLSQMLDKWYRIEGKTLADNTRRFSGPYVQDRLGHTGIFAWRPDR